MYSDAVWNSWAMFVAPARQAVMDGMVTRIVAGVLSVNGILFLALILGLVVDAVREKIASLRKGLTPVVESGHTVVLGWTERTAAIVLEICEANRSEGGGVVAVLADLDKEQLEAEFAASIQNSSLQGTQVVFRNGSRVHAAGLHTVCVETARSIIVLSDPNLPNNEADANILQVVLNLSTMNVTGTVVAEMREFDNETLVHLIAGTHRVATVVSHDLIGRLMVMFVRHPGLARVYDHMLGFALNEFYTSFWPELAGAHFSDVMLRFPKAVPVGVNRNGTILLNPSPDFVMQTNDGLIVIAEDNNSYAPESAADISVPYEAALPPPEEKAPEKVLIAGWRRDIKEMLLMLDKLLAPDSEVHIMCEMSIEDRLDQLKISGFDAGEMSNISLCHHLGNTSIRRHLEMLPIFEFDSAIIVADRSRWSGPDDIMSSDSHCLATLLLIRGLQAHHKHMIDASSLKGNGSANWSAKQEGVGRRGSYTFEDIGRLAEGGAEDFDVWEEAALISVPTVCEILDSRTQRTVNESEKISAVSDFMQSNSMISRIMAMISEDHTVKTILDTLLGATGAQFEVMPASKVVHPEAMVCFWEVAQKVSRRGMILCGYICAAVGGAGKPQCMLNPDGKDVPQLWEDHLLVVMANAEGAVHAGAKAPALLPRSPATIHNTYGV